MPKKRCFQLLYIILAICIICLIPFALEHFVFRNSIYSVLDNGEWSGFLGSYIGGVLGGIGTLLAVYITTKETRKIQSENFKQFRDGQAYDAKKERKQFTDGVAQDIARYITNISTYFYANRALKTLYQKRDNINSELQETKYKIQKHLNAKEKIDSEKQTKSYLCADTELEQLKQKEVELNFNLEKVAAETEANRADRTIANECYFLLKIKLKDIEAGESVVEKLEYIHKNSANVDGTNLEFIEDETKKLLNITVRFIDKYVNQKLF